MTLLIWFQIFLFLGVILATIPLLGSFLAKVFAGQKTILHPYFEWLEILTYRIVGINPNDEMPWRRYAKSMLLFGLCGFLVLFLLLLFQSHLPFNPQNFPNVPLSLAFNIAISFVTHTNWQSYAGEATLSYASQMWGLTVQNFLSVGTSCAVLMALIRGLTRKTAESIGNFWADLVRSIVYVFLPLSIILSMILVTQGVVQTLNPYVVVETLEGGQQTIALGPVASQVAIKQLGSNGGGFFNANSAHPFENPTTLSNFLEMIVIILIPASMVYAFGVLINSKRHAWMILGTMFFIWGCGLIISMYSENLVNPVLEAAPIMEGKETRFGLNNSLLWTTSTTATSNGSVNAMISSLSPLSGGVALLNMMLGEMVFGGAGVGLCSMLMFIILTIFLSGLMVGRSPEYLGKKISKYDIQWVLLAVLGPGALILIGAGLSCALSEPLKSLSSDGPHGLSELLYAFSSAAANNGSAFAGINANTEFYNIVLGITMLLGRLSILLPALAIAGNMTAKKVSPPSLGTLPTTSFLFGVLLCSVIVIVGALTFFPALSLGPIVEHFLMLEGNAFAP